MHQIAFDGLTLPKRVPVDQSNDDQPWNNPAALAPGNRTDFMVRIPEDATERGGLVSFLDGIAGLTETTEAVELSIHIEGAPVTHPWSDDETLPGPGFVDFDETDLPTRRIDFSPQFGIDGAQYDGEVHQTMELGTEEHWTVTNSTGGIHAYHIHVNPFFITHINGRALTMDDPLRRWQDTIGVPLQEDGVPGSVSFKTRFETFRGKFVIHCHILRHEDLGMMQTVEVI